MNAEAEIDISIIIPTFNRLWCLPQAIDSCRGSNAKVEIIVVDDGSTDGTWEWLQQQTDVISIGQTNWGQTWAKNLGYALARGKYVRFLDSDDLLPDYANDLQLGIARENDADVVVAGHIVWDEATESKRELAWHPCDDFIAQQLGECDSSHCYAYLYRREFVEDIPHRPDFSFRDDRLFVIEVAAKQPRVAVCGKPCLVHRHHARGRLQFQKEMASVVQNWQHRQLYVKALNILQNRGQLTRRRKRAAINALWPLAHWTAYTNPREACEIARWIYELDPAFVPPERGALGLLYRHLGFRGTEIVLSLRRMIVTTPRMRFARAAETIKERSRAFSRAKA